MVRAFVVFGVLCALSIPAMGIDNQGLFTVLSHGSQSCGTFLKNVETNPVARYQYQGYVEGFATGVNSYARGRSNFFATTDAEARYRFVYEYCKANPLDSLMSALGRMAHNVGVPTN